MTTEASGTVGKALGLLTLLGDHPHGATAAQIALVGASLGGVHTLATHPPSVTHTQMTPEERAFQELVARYSDHHDVVVDGDVAAGVWHETATTASGEPWENHGVDVVHVRDGRVVALHENNDVRKVYDWARSRSPACVLSGTCSGATLALLLPFLILCWAISVAVIAALV